MPAPWVNSTLVPAHFPGAHYLQTAPRQSRAVPHCSRVRGRDLCWSNPEQVRITVLLALLLRPSRRLLIGTVRLTCHYNATTQTPRGLN